MDADGREREEVWVRRAVRCQRLSVNNLNSQNDPSVMARVRRRTAFIDPYRSVTDVSCLGRNSEQGAVDRQHGRPVASRQCFIIGARAVHSQASYRPH